MLNVSIRPVNDRTMIMVKFSHQVVRMVKMVEMEQMVGEVLALVSR